MEYLKKICYFYVFAQMFLHLCPSKTYEKYMKMLTEWIAICLLLIPFLGNARYEKDFDEWTQKWEEITGETLENVQEDWNQQSDEMVQETAKAAVEEAKEGQEESINGKEMEINENVE